MLDVFERLEVLNEGDGLVLSRWQLGEVCKAVEDALDNAETAGLEAGKNGRAAGSGKVLIVVRDGEIPPVSQLGVKLRHV